MSEHEPYPDPAEGHSCESCGEAAFSNLSIYPEGEERIWFCEECLVRTFW